MDQLAAGELTLGRLDRAVQLPTLADSDDALERDPTFLAGELVDDVDDADRVNGDGLLLRQQPLGFDFADDVGDRGDVGAGRLDDSSEFRPFRNRGGVKRSPCGAPVRSGAPKHATTRASVRFRVPGQAG
jgi:hypothetical protein